MVTTGFKISHLSPFPASHHKSAFLAEWRVAFIFKKHESLLSSLEYTKLRANIWFTRTCSYCKQKSICQCRPTWWYHYKAADYQFHGRMDTILAWNAPSYLWWSDYIQLWTLGEYIELCNSNAKLPPKKKQTKSNQTHKIKRPQPTNEQNQTHNFEMSPYFSTLKIQRCSKTWVKPVLS